MPLKSVLGTVVRGHGVASGEGGDPRFPGGMSLKLELDLSQILVLHQDETP
ncbi:hypothetical protein IQ260_08110 [Leptolyngbya cf. ectocarpi LEGE 11479]|uniref:Uncharacterized protein n=1 Tax=Leptolyngbya cf. ectocarpi LEGE 11479 TaxID=1828722 RepID=A0A928X038_LEPEC|nr:hypothetical protein [Leptolyngbya ectocarpi]MBE9066615.1 hypothetical protein [Leptolyngbya cf. ectocarpi LEGE 11479]